MEVIRHRVLVDLAQRAFLRAQAAGEVAEMIHGERDVGVQRLADRLAVVDGLGIREQLEVLLDAVGDPEQDVRAPGRRGAAPCIGGRVSRVQRELDVFGARARGARERLAVDRRDHVEVLALEGRHELAADEVVVLRLERERGTRGAGSGVEHGRSPAVSMERGWQTPVGLDRRTGTPMPGRKRHAIALPSESRMKTRAKPEVRTCRTPLCAPSRWHRCHSMEQPGEPPRLSSTGTAA